MSDEEMHETWRHMSMKKQLQMPDGSIFARGPRRPTPVHGIPSKRDFEAAAAASAVGGAIGGAVDNASERLLASAVANGTTSRLGVEVAAPMANFPLGTRSQVPALGNNIAAMYAKKRHASSQQFTRQFPPDAFY